MKLVYRIFVVLLLGIMVAMLFVSNGMLVKGTNKISKFVTNI